jgi:putative Ca2+/H+ antiporter (TMEM165/GDT1 family)
LASTVASACPTTRVRKYCSARASNLGVRPLVPTMGALVLSTLVVALDEIGDKTQLLFLVLATRFQRPVPMNLGILSATLANHLLAGFVAKWVRSAVSPDVLCYVLGDSLLALAAWMLVPDTSHGPMGAFA